MVLIPVTKILKIGGIFGAMDYPRLYKFVVSIFISYVNLEQEKNEDKNFSAKEKQFIDEIILRMNKISNLLL